MDSELTSLLDFLPQPAFLVEKMVVTYRNSAAKALFIEPNAQVEAYLGDAISFYRSFDGRTPMALMLHLCGFTYPATVFAIHDKHIFMVDAAEKSAVSSDMLLSVSRNIRLPLSNLFSAANQLFPELEEAEDTKFAQQMEIMNRAMYQLLRVACNLTELDCVVKQSLQVFRKKTDLREFLSDFYLDAKPLCAEAGISLTCDLPDRQLFAWIDRNCIERAICNLLGNSLKYTPRGGKIELQLEQTSSHAVFHMIDSGSGIDPKVFATAFSRYEQSELPGISRGGLGFGLPYAKQVAQAHGGMAVLNTSPDEGTHVILTLSLAEPPKEEQTISSPVADFDYSGGIDHMRLELSDTLPADVFSSMNLN